MVNEQKLREQIQGLKERKLVKFILNQIHQLKTNRKYHIGLVALVAVFSVAKGVSLGIQSYDFGSCEANLKHKTALSEEKITEFCEKDRSTEFQTCATNVAQTIGTNDIVAAHFCLRNSSEQFVQCVKEGYRGLSEMDLALRCFSKTVTQAKRKKEQANLSN